MEEDLKYEYDLQIMQLKSVNLAKLGDGLDKSQMLWLEKQQDNNNKNSLKIGAC